MAWRPQVIIAQGRPSHETRLIIAPCCNPKCHPVKCYLFTLSLRALMAVLVKTLIIQRVCWRSCWTNGMCVMVLQTALPCCPHNYYPSYLACCHLQMLPTWLMLAPGAKPRESKPTVFLLLCCLDIHLDRMLNSCISGYSAWLEWMGICVSWSWYY
jgi:hypothetical protein